MRSADFQLWLGKVGILRTQEVLLVVVTRYVTHILVVYLRGKWKYAVCLFCGKVNMALIPLKFAARLCCRSLHQRIK